jgi:hypothetical protein
MHATTAVAACAFSHPTRKLERKKHIPARQLLEDLKKIFFYSLSQHCFFRSYGV